MKLIFLKMKSTLLQMKLYYYEKEIYVICTKTYQQRKAHMINQNITYALKKALTSIHT